MGFVIVTQFNSTTGAVEKSFRGFASAAEAQARADALPEPWLSAAVVLAEPAEGDPARWFADDPAVPTALAYIAKPTPTNAEIAAGLEPQKTDFCVQFRTVYAAQGAPLGAVTGSVSDWVEAQIAAMPTSDAFTAAQQAEALDRWAAASRVERANPLIDVLALFWFGDAAALADSDPAVAAAEVARIEGVTDQLFIDAAAMEAG